MLMAAFWHLAHAQRLLGRKPFREWVAAFDRLEPQAKPPPVTPEDQCAAREIGWAVSTAASRTPWDSTCLVQVVAAQRMLQDRGIGGVFHIGADKDKEPESQGFAAHAWLECGGDIVVGEAGHERFTVISSFLWG